MAHIKFKVTLSGNGKTIQEAWLDAVEGFSQDPGNPHDEEFTIKCDTCDQPVDFMGDLDENEECKSCREAKE